MCLVHLTFKVSGLARLYARGPLERRVMHLLSMTPHIICYPSTRVIPREYPLVL